MKPFLRWAGGKVKLITKIAKFLPSEFNNLIYCEPFLGAGSLFFRTQPQNALLSDLNGELIQCYKAIQNDVNSVYAHLLDLVKQNNKDFYYETRNRYNFGTLSTYEKAATFIYLNKAGFNGIWRVNKKGEYNVPYGVDTPAILNKEDFLSISQALSTAKITQCSYQEALSSLDDNHFVYIDPPYPPLTPTSHFTHYTQARFSLENHRDLAKCIHVLTDRGTKVMVSNADVDLIRQLFEDPIYYFHELNVTRMLRTDGERYKVKEVVITNYQTSQFHNVPML